ncbi:zinc-ribbon domain-containing protein, partial [Ferroplasma sp.]|uniref:zinc-ribbon domain-containing protein n=1 Tax=Ferroplasma sp. TaxID=2591003 RepID=UPI0026345571
NQVLSELKNDGYIQVIEHIVGRRTYEINITDKGRAVARKLKEAEEVAESPANQEAEGVIHIAGEEINVALTPEERENSKYLKFLFHFNVLDNHITVEEAVPGKRSRIFNIYVKQNGNGIFRLWCEQDDSYECWHVREAWTYPQVQKMMTQYKGKVKICPVCGAENRERAHYCDNCGAKLE